MGGTPFQVWVGKYPILGLGGGDPISSLGGGVPHFRSGWWGGYPGYPRPGLDGGGVPGVPPRPGLDDGRGVPGVPPNQVWMG